MTRIVAGVARGRRLEVPAGDGTRPTSDRAREALFSTIESLAGPLAGARVLDLYAGSAAVGLEALSRGAAHALLVERDPRAAAAARANAATVGCPGAEVLRVAVQRLATGPPPSDPYDVVFADPPYSLPADELRSVLTALSGAGWFADQALVAVERASRDQPWRWPAGFVAVRERRYGEGTLWYGHAPGAGSDGTARRGDPVREGDHG